MSFEITVLGSSSALPTYKRFPSAHVVNIHERFFLIDCGEGTQIQLRRFKIKYSKIDHIFISHLHGDHYFGIFGLISSYKLLGRIRDLHIYSPGDLDKKVFTIIKKKELNFNIFFHKLNNKTKETIYESKRIKVSCFPLKHRITTYGYLFEEKEHERNIIKDVIQEYNLSIKDILSIKQGKDFIQKDGNIIPNNKLSIAPFKARSYAFCSDTLFDDSIIEHIKEADILYHEATFASDMRHTAQSTGHSTSEDAAIIAKKANVKKLLIGHFSSRYKDFDKLIEEALKIFPHTIGVQDGNNFTIEQIRKNE